jgi:outer membrane lipoprotein-sorting protein
MTSAVDKGTDQEAEIIVYDSSRYGSRIDTYIEGKAVSSIYSQPRQNTCVMVIPEAKKYIRMSFTDEQYRLMQAKEKNPREFIKLFLAIEHTNLGRDTIAGVEVEGIEVDSPKVGGGMFESAIGRLWVDVQTELPVLMEVEGVSSGGKTEIVMDEFQWDAELNPSMFEPNIPADYSLLTEVRMPSPDEGQMIKGLRLFAEISGGRYPSSLASMTVQEEFRKALEENYSGKPPREVIEKGMSINSISAFYTKLLEENKELEYYGDKVTVEDTDTELMRWQIAEGEYRVIYGDLRTENVVDKEMLLDMALKMGGEELPLHKRGKVLRMLGLNEKDLIRGLGVWLELLDGKYPHSLEPKAAIRQSEPLLIAKYYDAKQVIKGKEKELEEKTSDIFFASAFYDKLVRGKKDVAYYGDKITVEDSDKMLVRWKISNNQYRIVFGNLTRKTVTAKELAELEKLALE